MISIRPTEYYVSLDNSDIPAASSAWSLTSPDATVWAGSITTAGIVSIASGGTAGDSVVFIGLDGTKWTPTISNGGIITATQGAVLGSSDTVATLVDSNSVAWVFYVDDDGVVKVTTAAILPSLLRYPAFVFSFTPAATTDRCILHSARVDMKSRRRSA